MVPWRKSRLLVVEDDAALLRTLASALAPHCDEVKTAGTVAEAGTVLAGFWPDLVILDVVLPDGTALDVLAVLARGPLPTVVALSGEAGPDQAFALAQQGVAAFVQKPLELPRLEAAIAKACAASPDLLPQLRSSVGHRPLAEVEAEVRQVMVDEALSRSGGSRRGAARLLHVSRQLLQYILRRR